MRNLVLLLVAFILTGFSLNAQTAPDWTRVLQISTYNYPAGRVITADSDHLYLAGNISGPVTFGDTQYSSVDLNDMFLFKMSTTGTVTWAKQFDAQPGGTLIPVAIKVDANQNVTVVGTFTGTATFGSSIISSDATINTFIARFDTDGNAQWATAFASVGSGSTKIAFDINGNTYVISKSTSLTKFNISGGKEWSQSYPDRTLQAIAISGNNLYLGGALQRGITTFGTISFNYPGPAYNQGYIVKANLDGIFSDSLGVYGSPSNDGSSVNDIISDNSGNLLITGAYGNSLILRNTTYFSYPTYSYHSFIAKCDENLVFSWAKSSEATPNIRDIYASRLFRDNGNSIYLYGLSSLGATTLTYGTVSVVQQPQFLFKFDANGESLTGFGYQTTSFLRIVVTPGGKIAITGPVGNDGISQYGNFYIAQYNNDMSTDWQKNSSNHQAGTTEINYVKHDTSGNTYAQVRIRGYCNFFGTLIQSNLGTTINTKFDKSGNVLWINQIDDLASAMIYGPKFTLDKDNNLLTTGSFRTTLAVGTQNFTNANTPDDGYIVKYDPNGQVLWATQLAADGAHTILGITSDKAGNVIVSGEFKNTLTIGTKTIDAGMVDGAFVLKLDAAGNCLWANGYPIGDVVYSAMVATDENNNIFLAGEMYNFTTEQLVFGAISTPQTSNDGGTVLVKFNADGIPQWAYTYGGGTGKGYADGWPVDIKTDAAGNSYLLGYCNNNAKFGTTNLVNPIGSTYSYYLTKINTNGEVTWADAVYHKSASYRYGDLLDLDKSGNIYIGGHFKDAIVIQGTSYTPAGTNDFFVAKYSNDGVFDWIKIMPANSTGISALSVEKEDILSICGIAGKDPTLGDFTIDRKGGSTCIIATLGVIEPTPNTLFVDATEGSEITFTFYSNADWTVAIDQEWLTVNVNEGTGGTTLLFTAEANTTGEPRSAIVTITFPGIKATSITITIIQEVSTVGIAELTDRKIVLYPNPTRDFLLLNSVVADAMVYIFDLTGKMLVQEQIEGNKINISSLPKGVYTLRIDNKTGTIVKKFVKL